MPGKGGLYIQLVSVHGLVRGHDMELGRDADTGGQIKYAVELAKALAEQPSVKRVDLLTRQIFDSKISDDYAQQEEKIGPRAYIVRLPFGPKRYLRKEVLWPYLDCFSDRILKHIRTVGRVPDIIHGHYADAGYVAAKLSSLLEIPMIQTGHSLGRVKQQRLIEHGLTTETIETDYRISARIEAEEIALDNAALVVASTQQEVDEQYSQYDNYHPSRMVVMPPGVDIERFYPPKKGKFSHPVHDQINRFLTDIKKPIILAMSRPDHRKNIATLVRAYGEDPKLQALANLVIVAGNRDDIMTMEKGPREVLTELLYLIDKYDLHGKVAYPKHHEADDVPFIYRMAAKSKGVFINPALTEPFGLTLIEAAASGLPFVATNDGGPKDILAHCNSGLLVDPRNSNAIAKAILKVIGNNETWRAMARQGIKGAHKYFSWPGHAGNYIREINKVLRGTKKRNVAQRLRTRKLPMSDRVLVCDVDNTLVGESESLKELLDRLHAGKQHVGFGIATGRYLESTLKTLKEWGVKEPDFFITSVGAEIYYNGTRLIEDTAWAKHIDHRWYPERVKKILRSFKGIKLQSKEEQRTYKISYYYDPKKGPHVREIVQALRQNDLHVNVIFSHGMYLDVLPIRASKGLAVRYLSTKWGFSPERMLVAGDAGSDEDMLSGETLGIVVNNHSPELNKLRGRERIYFADNTYAAGILEGMDYYDFFGSMCPPPNSENN
ncbi:HAD-IIB family hydrolase [Pseudomonadota bacterium]